MILNFPLWVNLPIHVPSATNLSRDICNHSQKLEENEGMDVTGWNTVVRLSHHQRQHSTDKYNRCMEILGANGSILSIHYQKSRKPTMNLDIITQSDVHSWPVASDLP